MIPKLRAATTIFPEMSSSALHDYCKRRLRKNMAEERKVAFAEAAGQTGSRPDKIQYTDTLLDSFKDARRPSRKRAREG